MDVVDRGQRQASASSGELPHLDRSPRSRGGIAKLRDTGEQRQVDSSRLGSNLIVGIAEEDARLGPVGGGRIPRPECQTTAGLQRQHTIG